MISPAAGEQWSDFLDEGIRLVRDGNCRVIVIPSPGVTAVMAMGFRRGNPADCPFLPAGKSRGLEWKFFPFSAYGPVVVILPVGAMRDSEVFELVGGMWVN